MSSSSRTQRRLGRSEGALTVGLFMLSGLLALPALRWAFRPTASNRPPAEYRFKPTDPAVEQATQPLQIKAWRSVPTYEPQLAQFETVFWEPDDTNSLREWLSAWPRLEQARVLEIGTGTGLIALCCATAGAEVVATDINPAAVANARYNAEHWGLTSRVDVRQVTPADPRPFAAVAEGERFDLIISNPPWEDAPVEEAAAYALYDPGFALLDHLLSDSRDYLASDGRLLLAYGARTAIERILEKAPANGWQVTIVDDRKLEDLPEVFLPGLLLELRLVQAAPVHGLQDQPKS